jgi:hypothetical protein
MNKILACIFFLFVPLLCKAQHYNGYARSFYDNGSDNFTISSQVSDDGYRTYRVRNSTDERYTLCLFVKTTTGKWMLVGRATLDPGKRSSGLIMKGGTNNTLTFYYLSGRDEPLPTVEEVNRVESSY